MDAIYLMFDRPLEPLFMPKGEMGVATFEVPDRYLKSRHRLMKNELKKRFQRKHANVISIKNISIPDLSIPLTLSRTENLSLFLSKHRHIAGKLIDIFMEAKNVKDLTSVAAYCRDRMNPYLFNYALSVALLHRRDTAGAVVPNYLSCFPGKFVESGVLLAATQEAAIVPRDMRDPIVVPTEISANEREPEQAVAYFREDFGINLHHWHWHLVYPFQATDRSIVAKDRRGELFYYMHHQILARYNAERFSNGLARVASYNNFRERISEGYFPKLQLGMANRAWPPRFRNAELDDVDRPGDRFILKLEVVEMWVNNLKEAVQRGWVVDTLGNRIALDEVRGIDVLGNMIEASTLSPNLEVYGDLHNMGHILISLCHDPRGSFKESFSVMGDSSTAMRDPIFYRWHAFMDEFFTAHKNSLPTYSTSVLDFPNITITELTVQVTNKIPNELYTYWEQNDLDMSPGLNFAPHDPLLLRFTHLQNEAFAYKLAVHNAREAPVHGTVRIFMAPKLDERDRALAFDDQRMLMIELDKFRVPLSVGSNVIVRKSDESSVTIPFERTFRSLNSVCEDRPGGPGFCGCGWPRHMSLPKGKESGMPFDLFAMVSDSERDEVLRVGSAGGGAASYCGLRDEMYPDRRGMGYPFDRPGGERVNTLADFLTLNMRVQEVNIFFLDRIVAAEKNKNPYTVVKAGGAQTT